MRTPDEINMNSENAFLLREAAKAHDMGYCDHLANGGKGDPAEERWIEALNAGADALAYIQQLEGERDAIQADFNTYLRRNILQTAGVYACDLCKHGGDYIEIEELTCPDGCNGVEHWEWRGVKEDDK